MTEPAEIVLETVVREEWGRLTSLLLAQYRRLDLVEDALADAVAAALRRWPADGAPDRPAAWLLTAARRRVIDRLRAESMAQRKAPLLVTDAEHRQEGQAAMADPGGLVEDDLLRLVLMCTHPALAPESASALALRLVLGVSTHDIARLFLVSEPTAAARITRAKKKIVAAGIPFAVPAADVVPLRLESVAQTAYLAFTAGYTPGSGPDLVRADLAGEAIRLVRVVVGLCPDAPAPVALLALTLLQHSRRDARVGDDGRLVLLADQDRRRWRRDEIDQALALLDSPVLAGPLSPLAASYVVQARIAAEHATAATPGRTRWDRIVEHYDLLLTLFPSPSARLARAVAVAEASGPEAGLAALAAVEIPGSHRVAAVRAELLSRRGDTLGASAAYEEAIAACRNDTERAHLVERLAELTGADPA
ncbi:RNA polymerase sigma factor [Nocardioides panaciterrulae]|uniref:RNA polymerase sigma-70 factor (ECF subfamily) n=1 Tax=Nocardioides panaciterrulae TaxID=661492 RepID=A0A7Y9E3Y7_9ACTN|nr:RNA polymerase sigma-70 factor (ECF subfamily) [Nocardioides panaciterrulae]